MAKSNDALNEQIKSNLTPEQLQDLKDFYVERLVDNMSTKDLVAYVTDDMTDYVNKLSPVEFFEEGYNYWEAVSYTHLRAHETSQDLVCRLLLEKKKQIKREICLVPQVSKR